MARRDGLPVLIEGATGKLKDTRLPRLAFKETLNEDWLQAVLDAAPELLPLDDIDDRLELPLVSLGREISTPVGAIDNLFISRNGYLVVVETKLWRNAEARRQVVAQLIDYAAHVGSWSYSDVQKVLERAGIAKDKSLWQLVDPVGVEEHEWIDQVSNNLARGRMTLLVVGDGIRSETESLAEIVGSRPESQFRLALVEMRVFKLAEERYLIVPATTTKTAEVERAVVRVEGGKVSVETPTVDRGQPKRGVLSEEAFLDELRRQPDGAISSQVANQIPPARLTAA